MKMCKSCGKAMDDMYTVCPYCGASVDGGASEADNSQQNPYGQQAQYAQQNPYGQQAQYAQQSPYSQQAQYAQQNDPPEYTPAPRPQRSAYIAAILAFSPLGAFGIHDFYLDRKNKALKYLLISLIGSFLTCGLATTVMYILSLIEGFKILKGEINTDGTGAMIKMSF